MKDSEILRESIEVLETYGWRQEESGNTRDGFCAIGAISHASNRNGVPTMNLFTSVAALNHVVGGSVIAFNDDPDTSYEDVVLAMKQAAANLEEEGK